MTSSGEGGLMRRWRWVAGLSAVVLVVSGVTSDGTPQPGPSRVLARVAWYHVMPEPAHQTRVVALPAAGRGRGLRHTAVPPVPFRQCPPVGADRGCGDLIVIGDGDVVVVADLGEGPYDGSSSVLVGVKNSSGRAIDALKITTDS